MDRKKRVIAIGAIGPDFDQTPDPFGIHYSDGILKILTESSNKMAVIEQRDSKQFESKAA